MTPEDRTTISTWSATAAAPLNLALAAPPEDPLSAGFKKFCDALSALVPALTIKSDTDTGFDGPALIVGRHRNVVYRAIPAGLELPPFLEMLTEKADTALEAAADRLHDLALPLFLTLYMIPHCPHCPQAVRRFGNLAALAPNIRLTIVDGTLFTQEAQKEQIRAVPTLVLDGAYRWSGTIDPAEVIDMALHRDPLRISAAALRQMLEAGNAAQAAAQMIERRAIFPALLELLTHPRWSVRLGAMVTVEYLAEEAPELAAGLVAPLWERFPALDDSTQGDVVQVFGQLNTPVVRELLEMIAAGDFHTEVKAAAREELGA